MAHIPPSNASVSTRQLRVPTFNTSTFRLPQLTTNVGSVQSNGVKTSKTHLLSTINGVVQPPSNNKTTSTTKLSVDGKVVDILQKQQQQMNTNGNVVSLTTSSKDLLSNLAITKLTSNVRALEPNAAIQPKQSKTISVTVYGAQAKHQGNRSSNEKFLLPKTTTTTTQPIRYPHNKNGHVEVKKFVPEMTGLLTGLSTGIRGVSHSNIINSTDKNIKTFALKNSQTLSPAAINLINDAAKGLKGGTMILPATNYNQKGSMIKPNTSVSTMVHNSKSTHRMMSKPLSFCNNTKTTTYIKQPNVNRMNIITSYNNNNNSNVLNLTKKNNKPSSRGVALHTPAIVENRKYKSNKVLLENNKKKATNFKIKSILLQDFLKQEELETDRGSEGKSKVNE